MQSKERIKTNKFFIDENLIEGWLLTSYACYAQLPDCDIWLLNMKDSAGKISFSHPDNISNRKGYNNQPVFSPDGKYILYTSQRDSSSQTHIFKYVIKTKTTTQFTKTATSEYSPAFMRDGKNISVVMVEKDSVQRLWRIPTKGGVPSLIMKDVDSIGYYCWMNKDSVALFILTNPSTLQVVNIKTQHPFIVAKNIGRCIQPVPSYKGIGWEKVWVFTEKTSAGKSKLKSLFYNLNSKLKTDSWCSICTLPSEAEDFVISRAGIFAAKGSKIYKIEDETNAWNEIADFANFGISNITRLAISPDGKKMAVVSNP